MEGYGRRIRMFRNGDPYFTGKKMLISPTYHRLYEQFLQECSRQIEMRVKNIYTMDGTKLRGLEDFADGTCYVCTGGEPFRKIQYNDLETGPSFNAYSKTNLNIPAIRDNPIQERKKVNRSTGGLLSEAVDMKGSEVSIFVATSKAFKIAVFENGEPKQDGMRLILNHRNCKTFDQLMKYFSSLKIIKSGQVRKMYDCRTGKRVRHLSEIENGMNLALSAFDPFKKVPYRLVDLSETKSKVKKTPEAPRIVKFFPNGDAYHSGLTVTVTKRRHPILSKLLEQLNAQIELVTGKIQKIYTVDGTRISTMDEIKSGGNFVLVANDDPFIKTQYNKMQLKPTTSQRGLQGRTLRNDFIKKIRPITQRRLRRQHTTEPADDEAPPSRLKTSKTQSSKTRVEDDGMETEREEAPVPRKPKSAKTKPSTPAPVAPVAMKPKTPEPAPAPAPTQVKKVDMEEFAPPPSQSPKLVREVAGKPKTPRAKTPVQAVNAEKKTTSFYTTQMGVEGVKFKSDGSSVNRPGTGEVPEEEESIKNTTGREEEELFENESQQIKVLSSSSKPSKSNSKPGSKPGSKPSTAAGKEDEQEAGGLDGPRTPQKSLLGKSNKSISKIPKLVSSRTNSSSNIADNAPTADSTQAKQGETA